MFKTILEQSAQTVLVAVGCLFIFVSFFKINDISKFDIGQHGPLVGPTIVGVMLILLAIALPAFAHRRMVAHSGDATPVSATASAQQRSDAIVVLRTDHVAVLRLIDLLFVKDATITELRATIEQLRQLLRDHTDAEEGKFYPVLEREYGDALDGSLALFRDGHSQYDGMLTDLAASVGTGQYQSMVKSVTTEIRNHVVAEEGRFATIQARVPAEFLSQLGNLIDASRSSDRPLSH